MTGKDRVLSLATIVMSVVAITMSTVAYITPGPAGPRGNIGPQGPAGPTPNRTGIYAIATCVNATPPAEVEYSVDVFIVNFGESRQFDYRIRYFYGDGTTLAAEIPYNAAIAGWSVDKIKVGWNVLTDTGCAFPHILWEGYTKIVRWS